MYNIKRHRETYKFIDLTENLIKEYKGKDNKLLHLRWISGLTKGFMMFDSEDQLVGYISWEKDFITAFEVINSFRNQGQGTKILEEAVDRGVSKLSVNKKNTNAIKLYTSFGWKTFKETDQMLFMEIDKK